MLAVSENHLLKNISRKPVWQFHWKNSRVVAMDPEILLNLVAISQNTQELPTGGAT
jgi:hypothetical protein